MTRTIHELNRAVISHGLDLVEEGHDDAMNIYSACKDFAKNNLADDFYTHANQDQEEFERLVDEALEKMQEQIEEALEDEDEDE